MAASLQGHVKADSVTVAEYVATILRGAPGPSREQVEAVRSAFAPTTRAHRAAHARPLLRSAQASRQKAGRAA